MKKAVKRIVIVGLILGLFMGVIGSLQKFGLDKEYCVYAEGSEFVDIADNWDE